jgi:uncharacterized protein (DUF2141 family)
MTTASYIRHSGGGALSELLPMKGLRAACVAACVLICAAGTECARAMPGGDDAEGCTLRIHVDGLRNAKGVVGALLFSSPIGWPEDVSKSVRHESSPIAQAETQATILMAGVQPGDYGLVVLHDENKNMKLDRNVFGWPKEGFGFANNPPVGLRTPAFKQAELHVGCPLTEATIHILYK